MTYTAHWAYARTMFAPETMTAAELREIRAKLALTQDEFGKKMNVYGRTVRKWENSEREITGPAVILARILLENAIKAK